MSDTLDRINEINRQFERLDQCKGFVGEWRLHYYVPSDYDPILSIDLPEDVSERVLNDHRETLQAEYTVLCKRLLEERK